MLMLGLRSGEPLTLQIVFSKIFVYLSVDFVEPFRHFYLPVVLGGISRRGVVNEWLSLRKMTPFHPLLAIIL
jgi:hypothetical protein